MLRYYTYYSVGGYKDLYLGSSEDTAEATYYLPLLPFLADSAESSSDARKEYESLKSLPRIIQLSDKDKCHFPSKASCLISHAAYKLIYRHVEGDTYALALRDIACEAKDEMGRSIPFLIVFTGDSKEDMHKLDILAAHIASYLEESEQRITSFIGYDQGKNGLCFKLAEFNSWIEQILNENESSRIVTTDDVIRVEGAKDKVALLILPSGLNLDYAKIEQNIFSNQIVSTEMNKLIGKSDTERLIKQLEEVSEELKRAKEQNALMKKVSIVAGISGFVLGAICSCSGK